MALGKEKSVVRAGAVRDGDQATGRTSDGKSQSQPKSQSQSRPSDNTRSTDDQDLMQRIAALEALLGCESRFYDAKNEVALVHLIANETRKLIGARQVIVLAAKRVGQFRVQAVSSVAVVDRDTPFIRWIEGVSQEFFAQNPDAGTTTFEAKAFSAREAEEAATYPFSNLIWQPLQNRDGRTYAVVIAARERTWTDAEKKLLEREAKVFTGLWAGFGGFSKLRERHRWSSYTKYCVAAAVVALACMPVPLTTLAPVEIIADAPHRVTAPLDGVVRDVLIEPNKPVKAGQIIVQYDDTELINRLHIADQQLRVAESRYAWARQAAFSDPKAKHELAIVLSDLRLKQAEKEFAALQFEKTVIKAKRDGILIYPDKDKLVGRPVSTGEQLMEIADPEKVAARIEIPVSDSIVLGETSTARLFLDSDPLRTVPAEIENTSYHAEPNSTQQLVYRVRARLDSRPERSRIGTRGTAQLTGRDVPLIFYLLRRPIASARQFFGV